jgi:hypothetical protein
MTAIRFTSMTERQPLPSCLLILFTSCGGIGISEHTRVFLWVSNKEDIHAACRMQARGAQIFQKSRHQHQILGVRSVTRSRFHSEDSQIPRVTV